MLESHHHFRAEATILFRTILCSDFFTVCGQLPTDSFSGDLKTTCGVTLVGSEAKIKNIIPIQFGTNMSSLGVYRTAEPYESSKFGHSLRVDGLSTTNSNVRSRAIVIHPAWYVWESDTIAPGRTYGCLGVSKSVSSKLIDQIQKGSMIYVGLSAAKAK